MCHRLSASTALPLNSSSSSLSMPPLVLLLCARYGCNLITELSFPKPIRPGDDGALPNLSLPRLFFAALPRSVKVLLVPTLLALVEKRRPGQIVFISGFRLGTEAQITPTEPSTTDQMRQSQMFHVTSSELR